ncbi:hypothetical protein XANCAGTX0491_000596 [Xanthoria calcicola]
MATLAEISSAAGQCVHKLPTSCQLTAQLTCCACGDKRPQASSFSRYIDGVGFVLGGKRQERYCPNCQQFWDARIEVSGIPQSITRIPTLPDQTTFIQHWFDWHRGYSIITNPDGTEHRHVLTGESLSQVDIGYLPRTTEEIQAGVVAALNARSRDPQQIIRDETHSLLNSEDIDPEDRIFDTWSTSDSAFDSDPDDSQDDTTAAQHLLRVLRQNLEDLRANVIELTQRDPRHRASSQVSTVSSELNSITRSLGSMRQQHNPNTYQLAAAQAMDRPDLQDEGDDELLQRVGQLFYQRRQLLNTPESPQRNSQLAFLGGDIDRVLVVCDSRGRSAPGFGPSLLERAIALRNSIMGPPTHAIRQAQSSIAFLAGSSRSEQHVGGAQARGLLSTRPATPSERTFSGYQPIGYSGRLFESQRNSSQNSDVGNPRNAFDDRPFTAEPNRQRTDDLRPSASPAVGDIRHVSSRNSQPPRPTSALVYPTIDRESWQTHAAQWQGAHRTQQRQDSSVHEPEQNPSEPRVSRNNVQPRAGYRSSFLHGPNRPPTPATSDFNYFRSLRFPPFFSPSDSSDSPHSEHLSGGPGSSEIWPQFGQGPGGWSSNITAGDGSHLQRWTQRPVPSLDDSTRLFSDMLSDAPRMADLLPNLAQTRRAGRQGIPTEGARSPRQRPPGPKPSLDNDPTRPAAVAEEAKNINMECKVCLQQISNQVLLPCGK